MDKWVSDPCNVHVIFSLPRGATKNLANSLGTCIELRDRCLHRLRWGSRRSRRFLWAFRFPAAFALPGFVIPGLVPLNGPAHPQFVANLVSVVLVLHQVA